MPTAVSCDIVQRLDIVDSKWGRYYLHRTQSRILSTTIRKHYGFTLIEIAIVLAIIGLILGAVMYNSGFLIGNTKATSTVRLITDLTGAINDFRARYHYLPGDLPKASNDIPGIAANSTCDTGNGNGIVDTAAEISCVPQHLVLGGFIKGDAAGITSPFGATFDVFVLAVGSAVVTTFTPPVQNVIELRNIPCDAADTIDAKIDDGNQATGQTRFENCANGFTTLDIAL